MVRQCHYWIIEDLPENAAVEGEDNLVGEDLVTLIGDQVDIVLLTAPALNDSAKQQLMLLSLHFNFV